MIQAKQLRRSRYAQASSSGSQNVSYYVRDDHCAYIAEPARPARLLPADVLVAALQLASEQLLVVMQMSAAIQLAVVQPEAIRAEAMTLATALLLVVHLAAVHMAASRSEELAEQVHAQLVGGTLEGEQCPGSVENQEESGGGIVCCGRLAFE